MEVFFWSISRILFRYSRLKFKTQVFIKDDRYAHCFFSSYARILKCTEDLESEPGSSKEKAEQSYSVMLHETIYWPICSTMGPKNLWIKFLTCLFDLGCGLFSYHAFQHGVRTQTRLKQWKDRTKLLCYAARNHLLADLLHNGTNNFMDKNS